MKILSIIIDMIFVCYGLIFAGWSYDSKNGNIFNCDSSVGQNIIFVMDSSGSLTIEHWKQEIEFVIDLIKHGMSNNSNVGIITFSNMVNVDYHLQDLQWPRHEMLKMIKNVSYQGEYTHTRQAIESGIEMIKNSSSQYSNEYDKNLIVLITDGNPQPYDQNPCLLRSILDEMNIKVIVIGIGQAWSKYKLKCLVLNETSEMIAINNFDSLCLARPMTQPHLCIDTIDGIDTINDTINASIINVTCQTCYQNCKNEMSNCINDSQCNNFIEKMKQEFKIEYELHKPWWLMNHNYINNVTNYLSNQIENIENVFVKQLLDCVKIYQCHIPFEAKFSANKCC